MDWLGNRANISVAKFWRVLQGCFDKKIWRLVTYLPSV